MSSDETTSPKEVYTTSIEVENNYFSTIKNRKFNEISVINIDNKHKILEIQELVISNGIKINNNIIILKQEKYLK